MSNNTGTAPQGVSQEDDLTQAGDSSCVAVTDKVQSSDALSTLEPKTLPKVERKMIGRTDQVYNPQKHRYEYHRTRPQKPNSYRFTKYVIVVRRKINKDGFPGDIEVDIRGLRLQKALLELNKNTRGFGFQEDPPQIDPRILFHSLDGLKKLAADTEKLNPVDEEMLFELRAGIEFVHEDFADTFTTLDIVLPKNQINFDCLWTLYPPGTCIVGSDVFNILQAYKVASAYNYTDRDGVPWLILKVDYLDYDGKRIGWVKDHIIRLPPFMGVKPIWDLQCVPLNLSPEPEMMRGALVENGKLALRRYGRQLVEYGGPALKKVEDRWVKFNPHGRVMLDPETWERIDPSNHAVPKVSRVSLESVKDDDEKIMLLNTFVYGYSLGDKTWGKFSVTKTSDANWNDEAFNKLVLDEEVKSFVHDLVSEHRARDGKAFDDIVHDKGKGLVGLLAGVPGVGKTLTAEAIAEVTRRPLYVISSGELGSEPTVIHEKLLQILELAECWDAVVLLDEAEVFMGARDDLDLSRNAVVSVFLRTLEYYQGILILTTNRATTIDKAFQSRIHFFISYRELDMAGRRQVWRNFLSIASKNEDLEISVGDQDLEALAEMELNGRQIKNAVSVSQAVALRREEPLTLGTIKTAIRLSRHSWDEAV